ncbi:MAG TPA: bifunctional 5,10-methylenetetrahydrofolate dehydrogenase/5,10-methenyltetrahydrofolate cyclohydrolase [Oligoflexia bacterium]|nr:bifunctional 5,10-methylenetetrahydrofolate dehydrogenase/5,10-methenyltetrahydrofolate cyclohydrolase [Oligoflexia bacterium]HMP48031.1 bifunctional 5,10-methylenetetrahydrofolate dehydrogenase/5,10-methenyltetrahydrofolate cyclohydrolase [Oligoflexia bacterium]
MIFSLILAGKEIADFLLHDIRVKVKDLTKRMNRSPCLALLEVGDNNYSARYLSKKEDLAKSLEIKVIRKKLEENISQTDLIKIVAELGATSSVDSILVQLPLPDHIKTSDIIRVIPPAKDVDALHPDNLGVLFDKIPESDYEDSLILYPPTASGVLELILHARSDLSGSTDISGLNALVIGRSKLVGLPVALLLLKYGATVNIAHSLTPPETFKRLIKQADIIVSAAGSPGIVHGDMISPGVILINVGMTYSSMNKINGDIDYDSCVKIAGAITPTPGGVGPLTLAMLMKNVLQSSEYQFNNRK